MKDDRSLGAEASERVREQGDELRPADADQLPRGPAGFASGPSALKIVRMPSSRLTVPSSLMAGWKPGAKRKTRPTSSRTSPAASGSRSIATPHASSTSAEPTREEIERFPCLATSRARARGDDRRGRRDIEEVASDSAGPARVEQWAAAAGDAAHARSQGGDRSGDLVRCLAARRDPEQDRALLRLRRPPVHEVAEASSASALRGRRAATVRKASATAGVIARAPGNSQQPPPLRA